MYYTNDYSSVNLTPDQKEYFQREGYLVLDVGFDEAVLEGVIRGVDPHYERTARGTFYHGTRYENACRLVPEVKAIALDERVMAVLLHLFGRKPMPFQTLNFPIGTVQKPHSDTIHFNTDPPGYLAGVWVALEDIDAGNGALLIYPRSHLLPEVTMQTVGVSAQRENYPDYETYIGAMIEKQQLKPIRPEMKKGELLIWHGNLLHGGGPHPDKHRSRHSQVTHYFFSGCRYYTPMLNNRTKIRWIVPDWIDPEDQARTESAPIRLDWIKAWGRRIFGRD